MTKDALHWLAKHDTCMLDTHESYILPEFDRTSFQTSRANEEMSSHRPNIEQEPAKTVIIV